MGKVCAVIAEYNPFHNGHAHHLREARRLSGADQVAVMMSGCFTQRGEPTLFSPFARAEMALYGGADIVFTSPVTVSVREADSYATFNIGLLNRLPFLTHLAFGAECEDLQILQDTARYLESEDEFLDKRIQEHLNDYDCSHAEALSKSLKELYGIPRYITESPNNILGISYLRALQKTHSKLIPVLVPRKASYHALEVQEQFPSATSLRGAILRGDWHTVRNAVPKETFRIMQRAASMGEISRTEPLDLMLRYRIATIDKREFWALPDAHEGIENLIFKPHVPMTRKEMLPLISTKRYSQARVSRLLCHMLLRTDVETWNQTPKHVHLIGFKQNAAHLIKQIDAGRIQVVDKRKAFEAGDLIRKDRLADDIWLSTTNSERKISQIRKTIILK